MIRCAGTIRKCHSHQLALPLALAGDRGADQGLRDSTKQITGAHGLRGHMARSGRGTFQRL